MPIAIAEKAVVVGFFDNFQMRETRYLYCILLFSLFISSAAAETITSAEQLCDQGHKAILSENFKQAIQYYEQAQHIYLMRYDSAAPEIALTRAYLGYALYRQGKMTEAQQHYLRTLQILSKIPNGTHHPLFLYTLNNLATLMLDLGNYRMALSQYNRLYRLAAEDTTSLFHYTLLSNMATAHYFVNHKSVADSIWVELLNSLPRDDAYTDLYRHVACNYAHTALEDHNYELADSCIRLAHSTFPLSQRNTLAYSYILDLKAFIEQQSGRYTQAERDMKKVLDIRSLLLGEGHSDYVLALNNLANLYAVKKDFQSANATYEKEFMLRTNNVAANLISMSERQRMLYVEKMDLVFETYLDYAFRSYKVNPYAVKLAYDDVLFYKGLLLNTANVLNEIIYNSEDSSVIDTYQQLQEYKQYLINPTTNLSATERRHLMMRIDSLESIMIRYCQDYRIWNHAFQIRTPDIQRALTTHSVAIEFADFPLPQGDRQYIALILRKDSVMPLLVPLCLQSQLNFITRDNIINLIYNYEAEGARLSKLIWEPIAPYVSQADTIYYALTGLMHRLNYGAIPTASEHYISDDHILIETSSTRYLSTQQTDSLITDAVVFGGVRYTDSIYSQNAKLLPFLYNTLESTRQLQRILESGGLETTTYTEFAATKDSLCALSGAPIQILHIATHGYYIPNDSTLTMSPLRRKLIRCSQIPGLGLSDNMKRSGLLMAGASAVTSDSTLAAFSRTVLTARDVTMLNFSALDIVVLSACETARGDVSSEGIFGLQRAFKQAGVNTIVMTLWEVNDFVTRDMMLTFYRYWMQTQSKRDAFRRAIQDIREKYPEPEYWAAYIMLD